MSRLLSCAALVIAATCARAGVPVYDDRQVLEGIQKTTQEITSSIPGGTGAAENPSVFTGKVMRDRLAALRAAQSALESAARGAQPQEVAGYRRGLAACVGRFVLALEACGRAATLYSAAKKHLQTVSQAKPDC